MSLNFQFKTDLVKGDSSFLFDSIELLEILCSSVVSCTGVSTTAKEVFFDTTLRFYFTAFSIVLSTVSKLI